VRGKDRGVGGTERTPLGVTAEHARPVDAIGYAEILRHFLERCLETDLVGSGYDEIETGIGGGDFGEGADEQVAAFFLMQTAEKEQETAAAEGWKFAVEGFNLSGRIAAGIVEAVRDDAGRPVIGAETAFCEIALGFGGEKDAEGVAKDGILPRPEENFFEVLERILAVEPGVERTMGEDAVTLSGTGGF
jgi:hypothetical protein